jgi:hypothetical protein
LSPYEKLKAATERWGEVQTENLADKGRVTPKEWEQWDQLNKTTTKRLEEILQEYQSAKGSLSDASVDFLEGLMRKIGGATRMTSLELERRNEERIREFERGN